MDYRLLLMNKLEKAGVNLHPLVTLEEFFTGNRDDCSIGETGRRGIRPYELYVALADLQMRDDVDAIRVELEPPKVRDAWPSTSTIWVVTSLTRSGLARCGLSQQFWEKFLPDDWLSYPPLDDSLADKLSIPTEMHALGIWYS